MVSEGNLEKQQTYVRLERVYGFISQYTIFFDIFLCGIKHKTPSRKKSPPVHRDSGKTHTHSLAALGGPAWLRQLSNEKRDPDWLGYIGDEILPSYIGITINHYKDPHSTTRIQWKVISFLVFFFVAQLKLEWELKPKVFSGTRKHIPPVQVQKIIDSEVPTGGVYASFEEGILKTCC